MKIQNKTKLIGSPFIKPYQGPNEEINFPSEKYIVYTFLESALNQQQNKLFHLRNMNELFTFNSQQFQACFPQAPQSFIRKRIISTVGSKRQPSMHSLSTASENCQSDPKTVLLPKKIRFIACSESLLVSPKPSTNANDRQSQSKQVKTKSRQSPSRRYCDETSNNQLTYNGSVCISKENQKQHPLASIETELILRKSRRIKSVKLAPRIVVPISDRKLPKVFKMMDGHGFLPPITTSETSKNLKEYRQTRKNHSSQRARALFRCGRQLAQMESDFFFQNNRKSLISKI